MVKAVQAILMPSAMSCRGSTYRQPPWRWARVKEVGADSLGFETGSQLPDVCYPQMKTRGLPSTA